MTGLLEVVKNRTYSVNKVGEPGSISAAALGLVKSCNASYYCSSVQGSSEACGRSWLLWKPQGNVRSRLQEAAAQRSFLSHLTGLHAPSPPLPAPSLSTLGSGPCISEAILGSQSPGEEMFPSIGHCP